MNLTILIGSLGFGGAERVTCNLANYMTKHGHKIKILAMADVKKAYSLDPNVIYIPLLTAKERKCFIYDNFLRLCRLYRYFKNSDNDCCCSMSTDGLLPLFAVHHAIKVPIVVAERANPDNYSRVKKFIHRKTANCASGFVFQTQEAKDWYNKYIKCKQATIIPNAVNFVSDLKPHKGNRQKRIISVARLVDGKNISLLLQAFAKISHHWPDYSLTIYGDGYLRENLEKEVQALGIASKAHMPGFVEHWESIESDAALYISSSDVEGMSNSLIEAMALGIPCISTDSRGGGARFLIQNNKNGLLVPPGNVETLAEAINFMLENPAQAERMGACAAEIKERLSAEKIYQEWEMFFLKVCKQR